jgi:dynein heavy chain
MSPIGASLRNSLRLFPSLINCCTISWFDAWPTTGSAIHPKNYNRNPVSSPNQFVTGLSAVASASLSKSELLSKLPLLQEHIVTACSLIHSQARSSCSQVGIYLLMVWFQFGDPSLQFLAAEGRHAYVTPSSFLDLLRVFQEIMSSLTLTINTSVRRYSIGLEKLHSCNANVETMKEELHDLQPMLKQKTREVQGLLVTLQKDQKGSRLCVQMTTPHTPPPDANAMREICSRDTDAAAVKQRQCQARHHISTVFPFTFRTITPLSPRS